MRTSYSPIGSNNAISSPVRQTIGLVPSQVQRIQTLPTFNTLGANTTTIVVPVERSPRTVLRESSPTIIRQSVNPSYTRESVLNRPDDNSKYRIISEKVYQMPPQIPQNQTMTMLPANDDQIRRMREEINRLNDLLYERNRERDQLETQVNNMRNTMNQYEKRIHLLANELDNLGREYERNVRDFQQSKEIFEKNIGVLRDSYLQERNNLVRENTQLRQAYNQSKVQSGQSPEKNRLKKDLNDLQKRYDELLSQVENDLQRLSLPDDSQRVIAELKRENDELRRRSGANDEVQNLKRENINLSEQLFKKDKAIRDLQQENRRLYMAIKNQNQEGHWC